MRTPFPLAAPLLVLALAACHTTESLVPPEAPALAEARPLPVTLAHDLRTWKETSSATEHTRYRLGALLEQLFPARDGLSFLSPVRAEFATSWNGDAQQWEASYTFALSLQREGVNHPLVASGRGLSSSDAEVADRAALEDCVAALYGQIAALLAGKAQ